jgi:CRP-like cAMP-binding protein
VILEGDAAVTREAAAVAELGPGDFFGEGALLGSAGRRGASVVASSPMRVAVMFGSDFRLLERELPDCANLIRHTLAAREVANAELLERPAPAATSRPT